ncbi:hypothetical protein [Xylanimonas cellulosilytica]|uniref:hypothetical protein n=1 Tax=Xylanimonas cellulosilytica TaxID=186189 RepID=UPI00128BE4EE|nr:hypothetical protein [Xylanimonas cellulosilytica]
MLFQASFVLLTNFARNSPAAASNIELWSLELQRFWMLLNIHAVELRATFVWLGCCGPEKAGARQAYCPTRPGLVSQRS